MNIYKIWATNKFPYGDNKQANKYDEISATFFASSRGLGTQEPRSVIFWVSLDKCLKPWERTNADRASCAEQATFTHQKTCLGWEGELLTLRHPGLSLLICIAFTLSWSSSTRATAKSVRPPKRVSQGPNLIPPSPYQAFRGVGFSHGAVGRRRRRHYFRCSCSYTRT